MRFQVRRNHKIHKWEVWVLGYRSWVKVEEYFNWMMAMRLATGQDPWTGQLYERSIVTVSW